MTTPTLSSYRHPRAVRRLVAAVARAVCPPDAEELGVIDAVVDHTELCLAAFPALVRTAILAGAVTYDQGARLWPPARARRAADLDPERGARYFTSWWQSDNPLFREFARALKMLVCQAYYEMPAVKQKIGYDPESWIDRVSRYRLEVYKDDIDRHQESLFQPDPLPARGRRDATREVG
jgi:hypothetical protein